MTKPGRRTELDPKTKIARPTRSHGSKPGSRSLPRSPTDAERFILVSKAAIAGGGALLLVMILGLFGSSPVAAIGSIAMVLGGIVSLGSNVSTLRQTMADINDAEALRSDLIGRIDLRVVGDRADIRR